MTISIFDQEVDHDTYEVTFFDDTVLTLVTETPTYVTGWISTIENIHRRRLNRLVVGLDVEWRPNTNHNFPQNPVATLQLCVGRRCLIFQILHAPYIPQSLVEFLGNASYTFTGVGIGDDAVKLMNDYNLAVARTADLRVLAAEAYNAGELYNAGLKGLTRWVLGKEIMKPKSITTSRWDRSVLYPAQVEYACIDAFLSFEIGRILIHGD